MFLQMLVIKAINIHLLPSSCYKFLSFFISVLKIHIPVMAEDIFRELFFWLKCEFSASLASPSSLLLLPVLLALLCLDPPQLNTLHQRPLAAHSRTIHTAQMSRRMCTAPQHADDSLLSEQTGRATLQHNLKPIKHPLPQWYLVSQKY